MATKVKTTVVFDAETHRLLQSISSSLMPLSMHVRAAVELYLRQRGLLPTSEEAGK